MSRKQVFDASQYYLVHQWGHVQIFHQWGTEIFTSAACIEIKIQSTLQRYRHNISGCG